MPVLIGGSPSTGSSLLRQILNRHSALYCGPETQLFTHPQLFENWSKVKRRLTRKPQLTSPDLHLIRGVNLLGKEQDWSSENIIELINRDGDFKIFCEQYFARPLLKYSKHIWCDKTPSNVLSFEAFLKTWNDAHVIHIVRNPLDIIASLRERGLSLFLAIGRYVFNTSHGMLCMDNANYHLVHYESLVSTPEQALLTFLENINLVFEAEMLTEGNPGMTESDKMPGWLSSELDSPNDRSVGRFERLGKKEQNEIIAGLHLIQINPVYAERHGLNQREIKALSEALNYEIPSAGLTDLAETKSKLHSELTRFRKQCLKERRFFYEREKPIVLMEI